MKVFRLMLACYGTFRGVGTLLRRVEEGSIIIERRVESRLLEVGQRFVFRL